MMKSGRRRKSIVFYSRVVTITHECSQHYTLIDEFTIINNK
jgi:hypothetical protein